MNNTQAAQIVEFLAKYNAHFSQLIEFLQLKQQKVLGDDLIWLHDSLADEQRLSMAGASLENKRLEMLMVMGYEGYSSARLLEIFPQEYQGRLKMECSNIEKAIDMIKSLNSDILEAIEKKIAVAEEHLREKGHTNPQYYDGAGSKIRTGDPDNDIIGSM
jgi:hypothetical protein